MIFTKSSLKQSEGKALFQESNNIVNTVKWCYVGDDIHEKNLHVFIT